MNWGVGLGEGVGCVGVVALTVRTRTLVCARACHTRVRVGDCNDCDRAAQPGWSVSIARVKKLLTECSQVMVMVIVMMMMMVMMMVMMMMIMAVGSVE